MHTDERAHVIAVVHDQQCRNIVHQLFIERRTLGAIGRFQERGLRFHLSSQIDFAEWQRNGERGRLRMTCCLHGTVLQLRQLLHQRESDPGPGLHRSVGLVHLIKALEEQRQMIRRNGRTGIDHRQRDVLAFLQQAECNPPVRRRKLHGVREQVRHDLVDCVAIERHPAAFWCVECNRKIFSLRSESEAVYRVTQQAAHVHAHRHELHRASFELRDVENLIDEGEQPAGIALRELHPRATLLIRLPALAQPIEWCNHERQWCAQFVRHVGEKSTACRVELLQCPGLRFKLVILRCELLLPIAQCGGAIGDDMFEITPPSVRIAQAMTNREHQHDDPQRDEGGTKPPCLVDARDDRDSEYGAGFVPFAAARTRLYAKAVTSGWQFRVECAAPRVVVDPVVVVSVQSITEADVAWLKKRERREVDTDVTLGRGQANAIRRDRQAGVSRHDLLDDERRRDHIADNRAWIDDHDAVCRREPQSSIHSFGTCGLDASIRLSISHPFALGVARRVHARRSTICNGDGFLSRNPEDAAIGADPEPTRVILENLLRRVVVQSFTRRDGRDPFRRTRCIARRPRAWVEECDPASFRADPEPAVAVHVQRANQIAGEAVTGRDRGEYPFAIAHHATAVRAHPHCPVGRRSEGAHRESRRTDQRVEQYQPIAITAVHAGSRSHPQPPVGILIDRQHATQRTDG